MKDEEEKEEKEQNKRVHLCWSRVKRKYPLGLMQQLHYVVRITVS